ACELPATLKLSLNIVTNSRYFDESANVTVADALVVGGVGVGLADGIGSQLVGPLGPSQVMVAVFAGSIIIAPNRPLGCWYIRSDGNRLSEPTSTGMCFTSPAASRSIFPANHWYLTVFPKAAS